VQLHEVLELNAWLGDWVILRKHESSVAQIAEAQWQKMQFLYNDEEGVHVMDMESFEQFCVPKESAADVMGWLQDGLEVNALMHNGVPVTVTMPSSQITVQV
jgi:translation elongation factor P/translation initiation factor 5A